MSSFGINGPSNKPVIQESQSLGKDGGGGGNTGFMNMRDKNKKKEKKEEEQAFIIEEDLDDTFEKENKDKEENKKGKFFGLIDKLVKEKGKKSKFSDSDQFNYRPKETKETKNELDSFTPKNEEF